MNISTGEIVINRRWRDYYDVEAEPPEYGYYEVGTVFGCMVDLNRGIISFFKDGINLGQAFVEGDLKYGDLFPFVEMYETMKISIFHPCVHPLYRAPDLPKK